MLQKNVVKLMAFLRIRCERIRPGNLKVNQWVDGYLNRCLLGGKAVNILTHWCLSKALEQRFSQQGDKFQLTRKEVELFTEKIPELLKEFFRSSLAVNWWLAFTQPYLDSRLLPLYIEAQYKNLITALCEEQNEPSLLLVDWEKDMLGRKPEPSKLVLKNFSGLVSASMFQGELERWLAWNQEQSGLEQAEEELKRDVTEQIAFEAEEGRLLTSADSPLGTSEFLLIPLEHPERFDNFTILAPDFKVRIVPILPCYPWRLR